MPRDRYFPIAHGTCSGARQAYLYFDCKRKPFGKPDPHFFGNLLGIYWPTALPYLHMGWLREKRRVNYPTETLIRLAPLYSLAKECCPPEFVDEILNDQTD